MSSLEICHMHSHCALIYKLTYVVLIPYTIATPAQTSFATTTSSASVRQFVLLAAHATTCNACCQHGMKTATPFLALAKKRKSEPFASVGHCTLTVFLVYPLCTQKWGRSADAKLEHHHTLIHLTQLPCQYSVSCALFRQYGSFVKLEHRWLVTCSLPSAWDYFTRYQG